MTLGLLYLPGNFKHLNINRLTLIATKNIAYQNKNTSAFVQFPHVINMPKTQR